MDSQETVKHQEYLARRSERAKSYNKNEKRKWLKAKTRNCSTTAVRNTSDSSESCDSPVC